MFGPDFSNLVKIISLTVTGMMDTIRTKIMCGTNWNPSFLTWYRSQEETSLNVNHCFSGNQRNNCTPGSWGRFHTWKSGSRFICILFIFDVLSSPPWASSINTWHWLVCRRACLMWTCCQFAGKRLNSLWMVEMNEPHSFRCHCNIIMVFPALQMQYLTLKIICQCWLLTIQILTYYFIIFS